MTKYSVNCLFYVAKGAPVTGYAPVDTISTTAGVLTYSISPSLPAGLVLDSATGV
ncbi:putative Ig domain-containing protein, partial [Salmonella enterica]